MLNADFTGTWKCVLLPRAQQTSPSVDVL